MTRVIPGMFVVTKNDEPVTDRRLVADSALDEARRPVREIVHEPWLALGHAVRIDHIEIGLLANGQRTPIT